MSKSKLRLTPEQALVLSGADSLPVDLGAVADFFGIKRISYADCADEFDITQEELYRAGRLGISFVCEGKYVCAINENACGDKRRRWTLAHELAHCLLGHVSGEWLAQHTYEEERCAEEFAAGLLAPLTVLHYAGVSSAEQTARLCGISAQAAEIRFGQLCEKRRRALAQLGMARSSGERPADPFLDSCSSRRLLGHFMPFITGEICRRALYGALDERRTNGDLAYTSSRCGKGA